MPRKRRVLGELRARAAWCEREGDGMLDRQQRGGKRREVGGGGKEGVGVGVEERWRGEDGPWPEAKQTAGLGGGC